MLLLDASKGALPVALGAMLVEPPHASTAAACAGMAAIIGHCYPVWLRFRGGKGVATALGTLVVIDPIILAIVVGIFALQVALLGRVSFGSLVAALCFPLLAWRLARPHELVLFALAVSALILWRHRGNLLRLSRGRENTV